MTIFADTLKKLEERKSALSFFLVLVLLGFGIVSCLYYGRIGFMPLDQSIIFDGGWRVLTGQIPFRDFTTPNGIIPLIIQAAFFKVLGVNWFAYCLHAAIFNGLFCVLVFILLQQLGGTQLIAFFYALISGVLFYIPFGVPYIEQHAFFFSLLAVVMALEAARTRNLEFSIFLWFLIPIIVGISYLSKQIPTIFFIPILLWFLFLKIKRGHFRAVWGWLIGCLVFLVLLLAFCLLLQLNFEKIIFYFQTLPSSLGEKRFERLNSVEKFRDRLTNVLLVWQLYTPFTVLGVLSIESVLVLRTIRAGNKAVLTLFQAIPGVLILWIGWNIYQTVALAPYEAQLKFRTGVTLLCLMMGCLSLLVALIPSKNLIWFNSLGHAIRSSAGLLWFSGVFLLLCMVFCLLTNNSPANGIPYAFLSLGIVHVALQKNYRNLNQKSERKTGLPLTILMVLGLFLIFTGFFDAYEFNRHINQARWVHDFSSPAVVDDSVKLPSQLQFMKWAVPQRLKITAQDFVGLVAYLEATPGNFFLIGDSSILYGITNRPSTHPALWFHHGLTIPYKGTPEFEDYENRILQNFDKYQVRFLVLEGASTWMRISLASFPTLLAISEKNTCQRTEFGAFTVLELCPSERH